VSAPEVKSEGGSYGDSGGVCWEIIRQEWGHFEEDSKVENRTLHCLFQKKERSIDAFENLKQYWNISTRVIHKIVTG